MTVVICQGCGRRASSEEVHCAACGRPLVEGDRTPPLGWMTAEGAGAEPLVRPEAAPAPLSADLSAAATAALFIPPEARGAQPQTADGEPAEAPSAPPPDDEEVVAAAAAAAASLPGGHGWRVRVHPTQEAGDGAGALAGGGAGARPGRLPRWVLPALVIAILATSAAAALLIVIHVMRAS
ncbi:MAG TPA: hypothetical protein VI316_09445 [Candidatus Dormibacteraeota bacterium]